MRIGLTVILILFLNGAYAWSDIQEWKILRQDDFVRNDGVEGIFHIGAKRLGCWSRQSRIADCRRGQHVDETGYRTGTRHRLLECLLLR